MDTNEIKARLVGRNIRAEIIGDIGDRWPVVARDTLIITDVLEASDDLSDYELADVDGDRLVIREGASDCLTRRAEK